MAIVFNSPQVTLWPWRTYLWWLLCSTWWYPLQTLTSKDGPILNKTCITLKRMYSGVIYCTTWVPKPFYPIHFPYMHWTKNKHAYWCRVISHFWFRTVALTLLLSAFSMLLTVFCIWHVEVIWKGHNDAKKCWHNEAIIALSIRR